LKQDKSLPLDVEGNEMNSVKVEAEPDVVTEVLAALVAPERSSVSQMDEKLPNTANLVFSTLEKGELPPFDQPCTGAVTSALPSASSLDVITALDTANLAAVELVTEANVTFEPSATEGGASVTERSVATVGHFQDDNASCIEQNVYVNCLAEQLISDISFAQNDVVLSNGSFILTPVPANIMSHMLLLAFSSDVHTPNPPPETVALDCLVANTAGNTTLLSPLALFHSTPLNNATINSQDFRYDDSVIQPVIGALNVSNAEASMTVVISTPAVAPKRRKHNCGQSRNR
jgi:hypothetical protein